MALDKSLYIHSGGDGVLGETSEADVQALVSGLKGSSKVAFHVHGGLVSKKEALANAEILAPAYIAAGIRPIFVAWESGFLETVRNNLQEIDKEAIFKALVKRLLQYAIGKLTQIGEAKAVGGIQTPKDTEVGIELQKRLANTTPYGSVANAAPSELSDAERKAFEAFLAADTQFQKAVADVAASLQPTTVEDTSKGVTARVRGSAKTLMSADVLEELAADVKSRSDARGLISTAKLIQKAGLILVRIVKRLHSGRDHGVYTTVVEEVLRELYVDNVGSFIWGAMKKDTLDTFQSGAPGKPRAGTTLMRELCALMQAGHKPDISFVGHSAGSIYGCNMLSYIADLRRTQAYPIPADFRLKNLVLLAPACGFDVFGKVLDEHEKQPLFDHFRMFALSDELESGYWEVPVVYPRSLLYFVSGIVETEGGKRTFDLPLLGMQRYYKAADVYKDPALERVRKFVLAGGGERQAVWSLDPRTDGLGSDSIRHGGFDDLKWPDGRVGKTMESVRHILSKGW
jgi:pimeloyl-ACP methyl ester carboxylesterase